MSEAPIRGLGAFVLASPNRDTLERCLASLIGIVERLYVGVQAHDERSMNVAVFFGAQVVPIVWNDDFSSALNPLIDLVQEDWILRLDDDMWFESYSRDELEFVVRSDSEESYKLLVIDELPDRRKSFSYQGFLWKRSLNLCYVGLVHERLFDSKTGKYLSGSPRTTVTLHHDGNNKGPTTKKASYYLSLIERELAINPDDRFYGTYRWLTLNDTMFEARLNDAASWLSKELGQEWATPSLVQMLAIRLLDVAVVTRRTKEIDRELVRCVGLQCGTQPRLNWALVRFYESTGDYAEATRWLIKQLKCALAPAVDFSRPIYPEIVGSRMYKALYSIGRTQDPGRFLVFAQLSSLSLPDCHPYFVTEVKGGSLWIERRDYMMIGQTLDRSGFRPSGYSLALAEERAEEAGKNRQDYDWWMYSEPFYLNQDDVAEMSRLLRELAISEWKWPLTLHNALSAPSFRVLEGPNRISHCISDVVNWLADEAANIYLRKNVRFVEIRLVKSIEK